jgi:hypothetical protein
VKEQALGMSNEDHPRACKSAEKGKDTITGGEGNTAVDAVDGL